MSRACELAAERAAQRYADNISNGKAQPKLKKSDAFSCPPYGCKDKTSKF